MARVSIEKLTQPIGPCPGLRCVWQKRESARAAEAERGREDPLFPDYCRCCVYVPFRSLWLAKEREEEEAEICLAGRRKGMCGEEKRRTERGRETTVNFPPLFLTERTDNGTVGGGLPEAKVWHVYPHCTRARASGVAMQQIVCTVCACSTMTLSSLAAVGSSFVVLCDHDASRSGQNAK